jgi:hypothetical protein
MKKYYISGAVVLLTSLVYFTGLYTYFIQTEVQEALPIASTSPASDGSSTVPALNVLAQGAFGEVDFIHKGSGEAKLLEVNGEHILRLEDFNVVSGPDLYVYLSKNQKPTGKLASLGDSKARWATKTTKSLATSRGTPRQSSGASAMACCLPMPS